jgi:hypothetical protein
MDALKKAAEKVTGGSSANQQVNTQPHGQPSGAGGQQDYVDKGESPVFLNCILSY